LAIGCVLIAELLSIFKNLLVLINFIIIIIITTIIIITIISQFLKLS